MSQTYTFQRVRPAVAALHKLHLEMDAFAEKVAPIYALLGWTWSNFGDASSRVPTVQDIQGTLFTLIAAVGSQIREGKDESDSSTGGLKVTVKGSDAVLSFELRSAHFGREKKTERIEMTETRHSRCAHGSLANTFAFAAETREDIRNAFACATFASEWANAIDEFSPISALSKIGSSMPNLSGAEIYDVCPFDKMPIGYVEHAELLIRDTEEANGKGIVAICHELTTTPRDDSPNDDESERVGRYLYHSAVGAGTGLWDEFSETGGESVKVPNMDGPYLVTTDNIADYV